jgi:hypothetical protein
VTLPAAYEFLQVPLGPKNEALQKEKLFRGILLQQMVHYRQKQHIVCIKKRVAL